MVGLVFLNEEKGSPDLLSPPASMCISILFVFVFTNVPYTCMCGGQRSMSSVFPSHSNFPLNLECCCSRVGA